MSKRLFKPSASSWVSHEITTPASGIIGIVEILLDQTKLDHQQKSYLRYIEQLATDLCGAQPKIENLINNGQLN